MNQLAGKIVIVTGASRGIGRAIALEMAAAGAKGLLAARSEQELQAVARSAGSSWLPLAIDLRDPNAANEVVAKTVEHFGRLDILVNNAGATQRGKWLDLDDAAWEDGYALKFFGAMRLCRAAWPHLAQSHGCVINIGGIGGRAGSAEFTIGGSVNAAVMHLTKSLADLGVQEGVRVNCINPGSIETGRLTNRISKYAAERQFDEDQAARQLAAQSGVARFGKPDEVAKVAVFLATDQAAYINGALVDVDGGANKAL